MRSRKKPLKVQWLVSTHLGNEFKILETLTVEAFSPGTEASGTLGLDSVNLRRWAKCPRSAWPLALLSPSFLEKVLTPP